MSELTPGQVIQTQISGQPCTVEKFLGGGGQGEVYRVSWTGAPYALKWYFEHTATTQQRAALEMLVKEFQPPSDAFLWPLDMAHSTGTPRFGYLMRLRDARFSSLEDLVMGRIDPTFRALVTVALGLTDNFYKLHSQGLCYQDISFGNAFFDANSGEVLICDNDNVRVNRDPRKGVLGTPDFMAPEIVRGDASPSRQTDLYSLSVLLFYLFHINHPLCGKKLLSIRVWDLPAREKILGAEPVFIFDPNDRSNEAVDKSQDPLGEAGHYALRYWLIYPEFLREAFIKSFTDGLRDPEHGRVTEGEWRDVLSRLRDSIYYCSHCGKENFYDPQKSKVDGGNGAKCMSCKKELRLPFRIRVGKLIVMLTHEGKLYPYHLGESGDFDHSTVSAEIVRHPTNPDAWGLKNRTAQKWVATMPNGSVKDVEPERSVVLTSGVRINFGKVAGEICY